MSEDRRALEVAEEALAFVRDRQMLRHTDVPRCWGKSSDALALYAIGGPEPTERDYPSDHSDLDACERTYRMAPPRLAERMQPVLDKYRAHIASRAAMGRWVGESRLGRWVGESRL